MITYYSTVKVHIKQAPHAINQTSETNNSEIPRGNPNYAQIYLSKKRASASLFHIHSPCI